MFIIFSFRREGPTLPHQQEMEIENLTLRHDIVYEKWLSFNVHRCHINCLIPLHCTAWYSTVLHCNALHCTAWYTTVDSTALWTAAVNALMLSL